MTCSYKQPSVDNSEKCKLGGICNSRGDTKNCKWGEVLGEGVMDLLLEMIPAKHSAELAWITGKTSGYRESDVKQIGVNNEEETSDFNGRGDGTDGDDGNTCGVA